MLHNLHKYKEAVIFCIISSLSFILMAEAVKTVNPVTSTFITYGLTALIFCLFNIKHIQHIMAVSIKQLSILIQLNITTLANTLLAFVVMTYVSPLVYTIVFFGCIPFLNNIIQGRLLLNNQRNFLFNFSSFISAILLAGYISDTTLIQSVQGISFTLLSCFFAVIYMKKSEVFHTKTGLTPSQLLSVRFFLVIIACGGYSLSQPETLDLNHIEWLMLFGTAITGSVIPLFLMQISIKKLGATITAQFMPSIPVICMASIILFGIATFSIFESVAIISFSFLLVAQARYNAHKSRSLIIKTNKEGI